MSLAQAPNTPSTAPCPTCNTTIYQYNQHACAACGAEVCHYCEIAHAVDHLADKEEPTNAPVSE